MLIPSTVNSIEVYHRAETVAEAECLTIGERTPGSKSFRMDVVAAEVEDCCVLGFWEGSRTGGNVTWLEDPELE